MRRIIKIIGGMIHKMKNADKWTVVLFVVFLKNKKYFIFYLLVWMFFQTNGFACQSNADEQLGFNYANIEYDYSEVCDFIAARESEALTVIYDTKNVEKKSKLLDGGLYEFINKCMKIHWYKKDNGSVLICKLYMDSTCFLDNTLSRILKRFNPVDKKQTIYGCDMSELKIHADGNKIKYIEIDSHCE